MKDPLGVAEPGAPAESERPRPGERAMLAKQTEGPVASEVLDPLPPHTNLQG